MCNSLSFKTGSKYDIPEKVDSTLFKSIFLFPISVKDFGDLKYSFKGDLEPCIIISPVNFLRS